MSKMPHGELVRQLDLIAEQGADPEGDHADADELLLAWIAEQAESDEATRAFNSIKKWYA